MPPDPYVDEGAEDGAVQRAQPGVGGLPKQGRDQAEDADADEQGKKGLLWKCLGTAAEHKAVDGEQED